MKFLNCLAIALLCMGASSAQTNTLNIHLQVTGFSSGRVYITGVCKNVQSMVDSAEIESGGHVYVKREKTLEPGEYMIVLPDGARLQILLDRDQQFSMQTNTEDLVGNMQVSGCLENELLYGYLKRNLANRTRFEALGAQIKILAEQKQDYAAFQTEQRRIIQMQQYFLDSLFQQYPYTLFTKLKRAEQMPTVDAVQRADGSLDYASQRQWMRDHFWDPVDFNDTRLLRTKVIFNKLIYYLEDLTPPATPEMIRSIDLLLEQVRDKPEYYRFFAEWIAQDFRMPEGPFMDPEAVQVYMVENYLTRERAFWADSIQVYAWQLRVEDKRGSLTGRKAQNIEAMDTSGNRRALYDIQSPYIALFFYHAACDHCKEEAPKLVQFYREWKAKGVEVFAVAMGTDDAEWKAFIDEFGMDWTNVTDKDTKGIYKNYSVPGTPEIYLLNPDRVIIGKHLRTAHLAWMIENDLENISQSR